MRRCICRVYGGNKSRKTDRESKNYDSDGKTKHTRLNKLNCTNDDGEEIWIRKRRIIIVITTLVKHNANDKTMVMMIMIIMINNIIIVTATIIITTIILVIIIATTIAIIIIIIVIIISITIICIAVSSTRCSKDLPPPSIARLYVVTRISMLRLKRARYTQFVIVHTYATYGSYIIVVNAFQDVYKHNSQMPTRLRAKWASLDISAKDYLGS